MIQLYGIPQCGSVKKALAWMKANGVAVAFHDFKKDGVPLPALRQWVQQLGWESVLNRKGTTWRSLDEASRASVTDAESAIALMQAHPSLIKRPVVVWPHGVSVGFVPQHWAHLAPSTPQPA